jgi:hypothetical protein
MKPLHYVITLLLLFVLTACFGTDNKTESSSINPSVESLTKNPSAKISHQDGWTIVSKTESGNHVYWFLAPEVGNVSPAMFKKIIYKNVTSELETKTVSQCDAPKQTCDDLMKQYKTLSEKYK